MAKAYDAYSAMFNDRHMPVGSKRSRGDTKARREAMDALADEPQWKKGAFAKPTDLPLKPAKPPSKPPSKQPSKQPSPRPVRPQGKGSTKATKAAEAVIAASAAPMVLAPDAVQLNQAALADLRQALDATQGQLKLQETLQAKTNAELEVVKSELEGVKSEKAKADKEALDAWASYANTEEKCEDLQGLLDGANALLGVANEQMAELEQEAKDEKERADGLQKALAAERSASEGNVTSHVFPDDEAEQSSACVAGRKRGKARTADHAHKAPKIAGEFSDNVKYDQMPFFKDIKVGSKQRLTEVFLAYKIRALKGTDLPTNGMKTDASDQAKMVDHLLRLKRTEWSDTEDVKKFFDNFNDAPQWQTHIQARDRKLFVCQKLWPASSFNTVDSATANKGAWSLSGKYVGASNILKYVYEEWVKNGSHKTTNEEATNQENAYKNHNKASAKTSAKTSAKKKKKKSTQDESEAEEEIGREEEDEQ